MRADLQRLKRDTDSGRFAQVSSQLKGANLGHPITKRRWVIAAVVAALVLAAIGVGLYYRSHALANQRLTDKDTIVIADFDNKTGDAIFDDTLKTALTVALNQSPFLSALPESKVAEALKLMTKPADTKLTSEVA